MFEGVSYGKAGVPNEHRHITIKKRTAMYNKYSSSLGTT
jgi:hypothetical protein